MAKKPDSISHHEERLERMREEHVQKQADEEARKQQEALAQEERERKARELESQQLDFQVGFVRDGETREMLLERIRKLRDRKPKEIDWSLNYHRTEAADRAYNAEVEAGKAAVARAIEEQERNREATRRYEEAERRRLGTTETVHHPNPSQQEVYPTSKTTTRMK